MQPLCLHAMATLATLDTSTIVLASLFPHMSNLATSQKHLTFILANVLHMKSYCLLYMLLSIAVHITIHCSKSNPAHLFPLKSEGELHDHFAFSQKLIMPISESHTL